MSYHLNKWKFDINLTCVFDCSIFNYSIEAKQQIMHILEKISLLQPPERLLLYLRMPSSTSDTGLTKIKNRANLFQTTQLNFKLIKILLIDKKNKLSRSIAHTAKPIGDEVWNQFYHQLGTISFGNGPKCFNTKTRRLRRIHVSIWNNNNRKLKHDIACKWICVYV